MRNNTHWFVLTNYNLWVFGHFSSGACCSLLFALPSLIVFSGWTTAFVSPVFNYDSETPTVMECLTFWLASASQAPGSKAIPKVCGESEQAGLFWSPTTVYDVMDQGTEAAMSLSLS